MIFKVELDIETSLSGTLKARFARLLRLIDFLSYGFGKTFSLKSKRNQIKIKCHLRNHEVDCPRIHEGFGTSPFSRSKGKFCVRYFLSFSENVFQRMLLGMKRTTMESSEEKT